MKKAIEKKIIKAEKAYNESLEKFETAANYNPIEAVKSSNSLIKNQEYLKLWKYAERVINHKEGDLSEWIESETSNRLFSRDSSTCPLNNAVDQYRNEAFAEFRRELQIMIALHITHK